MIIGATHIDLTQGSNVQSSSSPLVSVIIPSYERPNLVEQAIRSVLNQTHQNMELLVIDDHSPTPIAGVLDEKILTDDRVNIIRLEENRGANSARNVGIRKSTGDFIAFLDDDDRWMEKKVQRQITAFNEAASDVGAVFTGLINVDDEGKILGKRIPARHETDTKSLLLGKSLAPFSTVMVQSKIIDHAGLLDERFPSWQDRDWYFRLSKHCTFESIREPLVVKMSDDHAQIGDDFESKRDISYPLLLRKHRKTAREYGKITERRFVAYRSYSLGKSAMKNGYYTDARKYLLRSIYNYPFQLDPILYFAAAIGGSKTHDLFRHIGRKLGFV